ncbi:glutathione S-transferase family protein [Thalassotalea agarivorans]|uniref:Glutathione S-transferase n=1 Tax=Thalassotalea agarivorans TaxID=349064 RepID=A0A1I0BKE3_THASX|nr:glutathione S-transferase family protein [Thalassotalea agarivorans]SET07396.1 glutathione S-transferase [Thalassotalea agarivorans]
MAQIKLTYFDINGGRGEPIRLAFHLGNIAFEDNRFNFAQFPEIKKSAPLHKVPVMQLDGKVITQSNAMLRYAGKLAHLYPESAEAALFCDEILDAIEDATNALIDTFGLEGDALKSARLSYTDKWLVPYLVWLEQKYASNNGDYFIGEHISIADLKAYVWIKGIMSGSFDYINDDVVSNNTPQLALFCQTIEALPAINLYYQERA